MTNIQYIVEYFKKFMKKLDIKYKNDGLSKRLSNLYPYTFEYDGIKLNSMEGFLQSLKFNNEIDKNNVYKLSGYEAWKYGNKVDWRIKQELYYKNKIINRHDDDYLLFLESVYNNLFEQNYEFKQSLRESLEYKLTHAIGGTNKNDTILTRIEFLYLLNNLRNKLKTENLFDLNMIFKI